jgi:hypothetical protein
MGGDLGLLTFTSLRESCAGDDVLSFHVSVSVSDHENDDVDDQDGDFTKLI